MESLTVIGYAGKINYQHYWFFRCECGNIGKALGSQIKNGKTSSCGCHRSMSASKTFTKHGFRKKRIYNIFISMKSRCYNTNEESYKDYGKKGVIICKEWIENPLSFFSWALENGYSDNLTIERKNVNGNYDPDNCCWIEKGKQSGNRRNTRWITAFGETKNLTYWSRDPRCVVSRSLLRKRIVENGWKPERAITTILDD